ncbi:Flagellin N-methylase [Planctomycetes bacterium Poly30]|uniref:Flagellin N-methylase n=1 Tax=Saltatorellus ferox TaxID=2528018 RepID=A0A518EPW8_9BACT|nr:Flagellin N-methylase [Planctomycetes bacterium Poly30]
MQDSVVRVRDRFVAVDLELAAFASSSGLACPPACGACCLSPEVEATVLEMGPMAQDLTEEGRADAMLQALALADLAPAARPGRCVMYQPDAADPKRGRCGAYAARPLICRVFAFGTRRERSGRVALVSCRTMRDLDPVAMANVEANDVLLSRAPVMSDHAHALGTDFPGSEAYALPINEALRIALERELLLRRMSAASDRDEPETDDFDGDAPEPPASAA